MRLRSLRPAVALFVMTASGEGLADELSPAGIAWLEIRVADREEEGLEPVKLRKYCTCMQGIVEDNEPFSVTEFERSYPPAHLVCKEEAVTLR